MPDFSDTDVSLQGFSGVLQLTPSFPGCRLEARPRHDDPGQRRPASCGAAFRPPPRTPGQADRGSLPLCRPRPLPAETCPPRLRDAVAQVGSGPRDWFPVRDQLGPLASEQRRARTYQQWDEVDVHFVEQASGEQLPGDIGPLHQDVLVPCGNLGTLDCGLQPIEGERPAIVAEEVFPGPVVTTKLGTPGHGVPPHGPRPRSKVCRPMTVAPTVASTSRRTPISAPPSGPVPAIHPCSRSPPSPRGCPLPDVRSGCEPVQGHRHVQHHLAHRHHPSPHRCRRPAPSPEGRSRPDRLDITSATGSRRRCRLGMRSVQTNRINHPATCTVRMPSAQRP